VANPDATVERTAADTTKFPFVGRLVEKEAAFGVTVNGAFRNGPDVCPLKSGSRGHRLVVSPFVVVVVEQDFFLEGFVILVVGHNALVLVRMKSDHNDNLGKKFVSKK
jgi:hypothetical protein